MTSLTHLILGGSGFVGRHVALRLARAGHSIIVAGRRPPLTPPGGAEFAFRPFALDSANWDELVATCDVIHHYAWSTIPHIAEEDPATDLRINVGGTIALLEAMARAGGKRLVFASSGGTVYGRPRTTPVTEEHPLLPISAHGASKAAAEHHIGLFQARGIDSRIARLSNVYGTGQDPARGLGAVAAFMDRALNDQPITIWGDGSVVRDYIHVADASQALARLATVEAGAALRPALNIASGEGRSLNQIMAAIEALLGRKVARNYQEGRPFDVPMNVLDITRARAALDWRPTMSFEAGLARMRDDLKAGRTQYSSLD